MLSILVADDHPIFRRGVKELLTDSFAPVEVGEAETGQELLAMVQKRGWDIVIMDITMPSGTGPELLQELKHVRPSMPVLILSTHPEEQFAVRMFKAGASGYLTKAAVGTELVEAIKRILAGHKYVNNPAGEQLASTIHQSGEKLPHEHLSDREHQILCMLASGKTLTHIANELCVSVNTISTYRARVLEKMNLTNNVELTHYAIRHNLVTL
jgi:two-component system, NarL family, invasion response regulator UvrY